MPGVSRHRRHAVPEAALEAWAGQGEAVRHLRVVDGELNGGVTLGDLLDGPRIGSLMTALARDIESLARPHGLAAASVAEEMRQVVNRGRFDGDLWIPLQNTLQFALYALREKYSAEADLGGSLARHPQFWNLPVHETWRFGIEQPRWNDPGASEGLRFENEPGYMAGVFRGLKAVIDADLSSSSKLTVSGLERLHDCAVAAVFPRTTHRNWQTRFQAEEALAAVAELTRPGSDVGSKCRAAAERCDDLPQIVRPMAQGYRDHCDVSFGLTNMTPAGLHELQQFQIEFPRWAEFQQGGEPIDPSNVATAASRGEVRWQCHAKSRKEVEKVVDQIFRMHKQAMRSASSEDEVLHVIAKTCATLERAHVFQDGNARTFGILLLNQLLLAARLTPSMTPDANEFDGYSTGELVQRIKEGQAVFRACTGGQP
jgi:hypothetical protein